MKLDLVILTTRSYDSLPSILLDAGDFYYLVNCPDFTQRIFQEKGLKIQKIKHILTTGLHYEACGGLLVMMVGGLTPRNRNYQIHSLPEIKDAIIATPFYNDCQSILPTISGDPYQDNYLSFKIIRLPTSAAFDIQLPPTPGPFLSQHAIELGVPKGPLFAQLKKGIDVTLPDGTIVKASECKGPDSPGISLLIVDCRSQEDLTFLLSYDISKYSIIVHFTPPKYLYLPEYISKFSNISNIANSGSKFVYNICFPPNGEVNYTLFYSLYSKLPPIFGPLSYDFSKEPPNNFVSLLSGDSIQIFPHPDLKQGRFKVQRSESFDVKALKLTELNLPDQKVTCDFPKFKTFYVIILGTCARNTTRTRSIPAYLILTHYGNIALDAGEGFVHQLTRKYG